MIKALLLLSLIAYLVQERKRRLAQQATITQQRKQTTRPLSPPSIAEFQAMQTAEQSVVQSRPAEPEGFEIESAAKLKQYISFIRDRQLVAPGSTLAVPYDDGVNRSEETTLELNSEMTQITHGLTQLDIDVATVLAYQEYLKLRATAKGQKLLAEIL